MQLHPKPSRLVVPAKVLNLYRGDISERYQHLLESASLIEQERTQLRQALQEIEEIYNSAPCGYHSLDENGFFVRINDTELKWLGYSREELINQIRFPDLLTPESHKLFKSSFKAFKETGRTNELEFEVRRKDGSILPVLLRSTAIYDNKRKFIMSRAILFDISERKQTESQLRAQNEKLYWLNQEKDRFIGIASHDLQHPIAAITMLSEHLLESEDSKLSAHVKDICDMIHQSAIEMKTLIKNYLDVGRLESGSMQVNQVQTDVSQLTADIVGRYQTMAGKKDILLLYSTSGFYSLHTDPLFLEQIIENLLSNSIKFTKPGKKIFVNVFNQHNKVIIEVKDQGVGIPKNELPLLFEKFQQLSSRPTNGELSTGLGLSIVKFLADKLNAAINVTSKLGKGSVFQIILQ